MRTPTRYGATIEIIWELSGPGARVNMAWSYKVWSYKVWSYKIWSNRARDCRARGNRFDDESHTVSRGSTKVT